jgi:hypothetical protein
MAARHEHGGGMNGTKTETQEREEGSVNGKVCGGRRDRL